MIKKDVFRHPKRCRVTSYYWSGFSTVQALVNDAWLKWRRPEHRTPSVRLQILPKEETIGCEH